MSEDAYMGLLEEVSGADVKVLQEKNASYGHSWKKRGGVGAFMMLARKWDRIETKLGQTPQWDIFQHIALDSRQEDLLDDVRDLRRYLLLVEAEMLAQMSKKEA